MYIFTKEIDDIQTSNPLFTRQENLRWKTTMDIDPNNQGIIKNINFLKRHYGKYFLGIIAFIRSYFIRN